LHWNPPCQVHFYLFHLTVFFCICPRPLSPRQSAVALILTRFTFKRWRQRGANDQDRIRYYYDNKALSYRKTSFIDREVLWYSILLAAHTSIHSVFPRLILRYLTSPLTQTASRKHQSLLSSTRPLDLFNLLANCLAILPKKLFKTTGCRISLWLLGRTPLQREK
jgi:hypothetical protein